MAAPTSHEDVLVYGNLSGDLVALRDGRARELGALHEAIGHVGTWSELRSAIPTSDYEDLVQRLDLAPAPRSPFNPSELGAIEDGDWPEWPQQAMLSLIPKNVQEALGKMSSSMVSGDCLVIPFEREEDFVGALRGCGFRVRRDDDVVRRACGHA